MAPVDACYELVGQLRRVWRGFDGGQQSREQLRMFFDQVQGRCRPVREDDRGSAAPEDVP